MKLNIKSFGFCIENAHFLATAANIAYREFEGLDESGRSVTDIVAGWGFDRSRIHFFDVHGTQAFLAADDEKIIISFRGTEPDVLGDWVTDAKIRKTAGPYGDVHRGFMKAFTFVWSDIEEIIEEVRDKNQTVWITGHSLGGALATLATASLQCREQPINVNGLYTFGSPRVGGHRFSRRFNEENKSITFRFVNNNDTVTRVPPSVTYSHIGSLVYFDKDGELFFDRDLNWWSRFWDRAEGRLESFFHLDPVDGITDHSMDIYEENVQKHVRF